ncbi:MAG TPA: CHRD domain-containing protein [Candidatus Bathyarchaeia archaeon]|jgi:hypothetical protein|nr:CHRD domain-containing protein [Candidatus Bathyarchaeia archaeon]
MNLTLQKKNGVLGAYIHCGKQGENGRILPDLFNADMSGPPTGAVNGQLSKGTITSADLRGPLADKHISDLVDLLKTGGAYINVHTSKNQEDEIPRNEHSGGQQHYYINFGTKKFIIKG